MRSVGHIIKMERKRQNMKQINLARGICSTSYLSKIENSNTEASEEVISLLLERLKIDITETSAPLNNKKILEELSLIYKEATIHRDKKYVKEKLEFLLSRNDNSKETTFLYKNLVILRLMLFFNDDESSKLLIEFLEGEAHKFTKLQLYLFNKNLGIHLQKNGNIEGGIKAFNNSLDIVDQVLIEDWEQADLFYMLGVTYISNEQLINAIDYSKKALNYFKDSFLFNRAIDCYLLLGIAYKKGQRLQHALETYKLALKITEELQLEHYKGIIYHNIGSLYSSYEPLKSIRYYKKSLPYKRETNKKLITIFAIIKEYSKEKDWDSLKEWIEEGFYIIEKNFDANKKYYYHFLIYKEIGLHESLSEDIVLPAIDFYESIRDYKNCYKYSTLLGDSLFKQGKYKLAAIHYQNAQSFLFQKMKINQLEEF